MYSALLVAVAASLGVVAGYMLGRARDDGRLTDEAEARAARFARERLDWERHVAVYRAFERAAQAASLWPHRINRRAELARHLLSLATAPQIRAAEPEGDEEADALVDPAEGEPTDEETPVDVYRAQGFL